MPTTPTYPGVYIEEVPSPVRSIAGVATSITAFVGRARKGPVDEPTLVQTFGEYQRRFGSLWRLSPMSYAVSQFFQNGGVDALIVRVDNAGVASDYDLAAGAQTLTLAAANPGVWGDLLQITVNHDTRDSADTELFNLRIVELNAAGQQQSEEVYLNLSVNSDDPRHVELVLDQGSNLVRVSGSVPTQRPDESAPDADGDPTPAAVTTNGDDGSPIDATQVSDPGLEATRQGIWALNRADLFNILCIPPFEPDVDVDTATWDAASAYCRIKRAVVLIDPPASWTSPANAVANVDSFVTRSSNAAVYYPPVRLADPLQENRLRTFAPCGVMSGILARTDSTRGIWKAPAGLDATLSGVQELDYHMTDGENGQLNPLAVNCLRSFPVTGRVAWGARTLVGADRLASEWKYLPVRRLALYIEESLYRGTQWTIFEPNDYRLWSQITLNVSVFMNTLFRQGAFQGNAPGKAYFVQCDAETNPQADIDRGIVNLQVGFAPLKPAEFLIIKISQIVGDLEI